MDSKMNELLSEIAHETAQGILAADEKSARAALEKIHASIESVLPVDGCTVTGEAQDEVTPVYRTPQHIIDFIYRVAKVPFADKADPELLDRIAWTHRLVPTEPQGFDKFLTIADGVKLVRFRGKDETRLVARRVGKNGNANTIFEINVDHKGKYAEVMRDGTLMYSSQGETIGHSFVEKLAISSLHRYFKTNHNTCEKKKRKRARKAAEKAAAEKEVAR